MIKDLGAWRFMKHMPIIPRPSAKPTRSVIHPLWIRVMPAMDMRTRSSRLSLRLKNPAMPMEKKATPKKAVMLTRTMVITSPTIRMPGENTNKKGRMKPGSGYLPGHEPGVQGR